MYLGVSVGFYYLSDSIHFSSEIVQYALNASLFSAFLAIVFLAEKKELRTLLKL
jgi:hypothetical protein